MTRNHSLGRRSAERAGKAAPRVGPAFGHGRIELDKFHTPKATRTGPEKAAVNELGIRRIMFAVEDIDTLVARLLAHGAELVGEVVQYENAYRLAYVRGPEGIIVGLAEELGQKA